MSNGASEVVIRPSDTLILTVLYVPTLLVVGVPYSVPVEASKVAHAGLFAMLKVNLSPSGSLAVGLKE
jgi:hypothetical protein